MEQAGPEPPPARVVLLDVQRAGAELEDLLQDVDGAAEALGPRERAVELDAAVERLAGEVDAGEVLAGGDLQVGEGLVVLEVAVVLRLDVLDEPGFDQQGVDLAVGREEVDVGDLVDPVADAAISGCPLVEIRAGPAAQVLRLADVDHPSLGVLHQVEARGRRELLDLLGRRDGCGRRFGHADFRPCPCGARDRPSLNVLFDMAEGLVKWPGAVGRPAGDRPRMRSGRLE